MTNWDATIIAEQAATIAKQAARIAELEALDVKITALGAACINLGVSRGGSPAETKWRKTVEGIEKEVFAILKGGA